MTTLETKTLRPGLLVSLKTSIRGNVDYQKTDIEADHYTGTGERVARWETKRTIADPAEHEASVKARGKARSIITGVCAPSAFGLLCPQSRERDLADAVAAARAVADTFNRSAVVTRIDVYVITGRVAADDNEALRAINSEMRELLDDMTNGVKNLDAAAIREAANKARAIGQMLTPDAAQRMQDAIDMARSAARKIIKAGDSAAIEVDKQTLSTIAYARTAFLDTETPASEVKVPEHEARALDMEPETEDQRIDRENAEYAAQEAAIDLDTPALDVKAAPVPAALNMFDL